MADLKKKKEEEEKLNSKSFAHFSTSYFGDFQINMGCLEL
jgi:hypothetical protein